MFKRVNCAQQCSPHTFWNRRSYYKNSCGLAAAIIIPCWCIMNLRQGLNKDYESQKKSWIESFKEKLYKTRGTMYSVMLSSIESVYAGQKNSTDSIKKIWELRTNSTWKDKAKDIETRKDTIASAFTHHFKTYVLGDIIPLTHDVAIFRFLFDSIDTIFDLKPCKVLCKLASETESMRRTRSCDAILP